MFDAETNKLIFFRATFTKIVLHVKQEDETVFANILPDLPPVNLTSQMSTLSTRRSSDYIFVETDSTGFVDMRDLTSIYIKDAVLLIDRPRIEASISETFVERSGMFVSNISIPFPFLV